VPQLNPDGFEVTKPEPVPAIATLKLGLGMKWAVTVRAALMVTSHVVVEPEHAPVQFKNADPAPGVAVNLITEFVANAAMHDVPQLIPEGSEFTEPGVPDVKTWREGCGRKVAFTVRAVSIVTVHTRPVPVHAPPHPTKSWPGAGEAVRTTLDPGRNPLLQTSPQLMPAGSDEITPAPALMIFSSIGAWKLTVTDFASFIVTVHVSPVPVHPPDQVTKYGLSAARSVTVVFFVNTVLAELQYSQQ
jgi:hypothetical protein